MADFFYYDKPYYNFNTGEVVNAISTTNYNVVQVSDVFYKRGFKIKEHLQICDVELTYISSGKVDIVANESNIECSSGNVFVCFKGEKHALKSSGASRFLTFAFNFGGGTTAKKLSSAFNEIFIKKQNRKLCLPVVEQLLFAIFKEIEQVERLNEFVSLTALDSLISYLTVLILRESLGKRGAQAYESVERELIKYLDKNYLNISSISELVNYMGYSYSYLEKIFKRTFGLSIKDYVINKKMEYALELLKNRENNVTKIANVLGYSSLYNFSRAFKNHFGVSPAIYKKEKHAK